MEWELTSIEYIKGLNGLDVNSANYRRFFDLRRDMERANEIKNMKSASKEEKQEADRFYKACVNAIEGMGITLGVAITFNPSSMPPLASELKYAEEYGLKIEKCEDGRYRWFKPVNK